MTPSPGENRTWDGVQGIARERTRNFEREGAALVGKKTWREVDEKIYRSFILAG
jgi:hypothetical protein